MNVVAGIVVTLIGALLCFRGHGTIRLVIGASGALTGFALGTALSTGFAPAGVPGAFVGLLVAIALAILFAVLAYFFYQFAVVLSVAVLAFGVTAGAFSAVGIPWLGIALGVVAGLAAAGIAIAAKLPALLLIIVTAVAGAGLTMTGLMLLIGSARVGDVGAAPLAPLIGQGPAWAAAALALAAVGLVVQARRVYHRSAPVAPGWAPTPMAVRR